MNDLENLQTRVGAAVDKLLDTQHQRQRHNQSLGRILNDLEIKFEARKIELDHCQGRIKQLEESNRTLTALVGQMVEIVEKTADEVAEDPMYRTTAAAAEIIDRYVPESPANDGAPVRGKKSAPSATASFEAPPDAFQNVDDDLLAAEDMFEKVEGGDYPRLVFDAIALATEDAAAETEDDLIVGPPAAPPAADPPESKPADAELGIKEIMARLEIAAERAQLSAQARAESPAPDTVGRVAGNRG